MSSASASSIAVIVPTYRRRERLPALLDSLLADQPDEVIVVVNGPPDGSIELLRDRAATDPRLVPIERAAAGKGPAIRAGVEAASSDVVLMLDDDVVPEPGLVAGHLAAHSEHPGRLVLGYMPVEPLPRRSAGDYTIDLYSRNYEGHCDAYESDPGQILDSLWGGNYSIQRRDWLRVAPDPDDLLLQGYHEDLAFGLLCRRSGLQGSFDRRLRARHMYRRTPDAFFRDSRMSGEGRREMHSRYTEELGPFDLDVFADAVSRPGVPLVRLARRPFLRPVVGAALSTAIAVSGRLHLFAVERRAAFVKSVIEQQRGALAPRPPQGRAAHHSKT